MVAWILALTTKANNWGTGFVAVGEVRDMILIDFSAPVWVQWSLHSEAACLLSRESGRALQYYDRHFQLIIFNDCAGLLLILSEYGLSDFWPDPVMWCILTWVFLWSKSLDVQWRMVRSCNSYQLAKWKVMQFVFSMKICELALLTDEHVETGCLSESDPICPQPKKYASYNFTPLLARDSSCKRQT